MKYLVALACAVVLSMFGVLYVQQAETDAFRAATANHAAEDRASLRADLIKYEEQEQAALARIEKAVER